ncbi:DUF5068 domain-containing protein [Bacillus testis]|uniref:DUF5068 domain-containing protein n=1 Tax=Bacillus testis TaxID=1622072 RepID=UPI00067EE4B7|nr:DUF5068 domain-containing protein [Bacillus testis]
MGKMKAVWMSMLSVMFLLAACGNDEKTSGEKEAKKEKEKTEVTAKVDKEKAADDQEKTKDDQDESSETATDVNDEQSSGQSSDIFNPAIAKETEGNVEVVYTNNDANFIKDFNGFKVSVDAYQIVKVTDMNEHSKIWFDDQIDGYVITSKVTIENATDKAKYYNNTHNIRLTSTTDYIPSKSRDLMDKDKIVKSKKESEVSKYAAGEKVSGFVTFALSNADYEAMKAVQPKYIIEGGVADDKSFAGSVRGEGNFAFIYSDEQKNEVANADQFYPDKLTTDNFGEKKMIFGKAGINETQAIDKVKVTLEGVQYAELIPNATNKPRFSNFGDSGIVAVTVKLNVDNQSDTPIDLSYTSATLQIDNGRGSAISDGMVEPREDGPLKPGEKREKYEVFLFRKDEFQIFKTFALEYGPFSGTDAKRLFKERRITFNLPR